MQKNRTAAFAAVFLASAVLASCARVDHTPNTDVTTTAQQTGVTTTEVTTAPTTTTAVTTTTAPPIVEYTTHFFAAGDNLIHSSIYNQAHDRATDGTYDFDYAYENIEHIIPQTGVRYLNQETLICNDMFEPSTYPCFNSPTQLGDKMIDLGFNAFCMSNNHVLDKGESGLLYALEYWKSRNQLAFGAYENTEDMENIRTMTVDGITFAFVAFTEHTNGINIPSGSEIKVIYTYDTELMKSQIEKADAVSDVVVVSAHWGVENSNSVVDGQRSLAQSFVDWGADIIIGTHPHTIQTVEWLETDDGSDAIVFYSLGNFISAQAYSNLMVGMLADFDVTYNTETDTVSLDNVSAIPIVTHYDGSFHNVRVYPRADYTSELAASHGCGISLDYIDNLVEEIVPHEFLG
ncbi:MAG: CapA family protein [Oscillospiraceae bacterium]|nr:CapA family protein [Oscillospiraceae bacterium]